MADLRNYHFQKWVKVYDDNLNLGVRKAYEKAEEVFSKEMNTNYYSSFESFKSARTIRRKKKKC